MLQDKKALNEALIFAHEYGCANMQNEINISKYGRHVRHMEDICNVSCTRAFMQGRATSIVVFMMTNADE